MKAHRGFVGAFFFIILSGMIINGTEAAELSPTDMVLSALPPEVLKPAAEITYTGPPITLRFSSHMAKTNQIYQSVYETWLKVIEKRSNGKIKPKAYAAQSLHASTDGFKACVNNITDFTHGYPVWQPGSFHLAHVMDLPFAFPSRCYYVGSRVGEELYTKYFKKEYEKCGVYVANYHVMSPYQIISRKPISQLKHLKGMTIRVPAGPQTEMMKLLKAVPVYMTTAETYNAFQKGIIDAVFLYDGSFTNFRLDEIGKYKTGNLGMSTAGVPFALNRNWFDALPKDLKKVFYDSMRICSQIAAQGFEATDIVARKEMERAGVKTIDFSPTERKAFQDAINPIWDKYIAENEKLGLPARELAKDLKALSEKYSTWTPEQMMELAIEKPISGMIDGM